MAWSDALTPVPPAPCVCAADVELSQIPCPLADSNAVCPSTSLSQYDVEIDVPLV